MKIKIDIDEQLEDEEIVIHCNSLTDEITKIQKAIAEVTSEKQRFIFYKGDTEYYLGLEEILFFETEGNSISAHTVDDIYKVKYRLYELEQFLPKSFVRVSKSTILNIYKVHAINRNLTASSTVQFQNTHKQVYVSRYYYKPLKISLDEKRISR